LYVSSVPLACGPAGSAFAPEGESRVQADFSCSQLMHCAPGAVVI
jgi:hypothetical protein